MMLLLLACGGEPHWSEDPATSRKMVIQRDEKIESLTSLNKSNVNMIKILNERLKSKWYETDQAQAHYEAKMAREKIHKKKEIEKSWCSVSSELIDIISYGGDSHHLEGSSCGFDAKCRTCKVVLKEAFATPPNDTLKVTFKPGCTDRDWKPSDAYCSYGKERGWYLAAHRRDGTIAYYKTIGIGVKHEY